MDSLYFDDDIYGGFVILPYSLPGKIEISGGPVFNEFYSNFEWELKSATGGYHDIEWNYQDDFHKGKFQNVIIVDEDSEEENPLEEDYFLVIPHIVEASPDSITAIIPRGKGKLLGVQFKERDEIDSENCMEFLLKYAVGNKDDKHQACKDGSYSQMLCFEVFRRRFYQL